MVTIEQALDNAARLLDTAELDQSNLALMDALRGLAAEWTAIATTLVTAASDV